jgi:hypothetical protein
MASSSRSAGQSVWQSNPAVNFCTFRSIAQAWYRLVCWACILSLPAFVYGGSESTRSSDTVRITVDSRWPGNAHGGYVPLRIKLTNLGPEQDFQLVFENMSSNAYERLPEVRRTVRLDQNATRDLTLPIPMVGRGNNGELKVLDGRGKEIEELKTTHSLPAYGGDNARASLLVIAADDVDEKSMQSFEDAAATECASLRGTTITRSSGFHASSTMVESDHLIIPPTNLPENWIDYSGVDLIAISWPNMSGKLKSTEREALLKWAACGGVLIVYGTDKPAAELEPLQQLLQLDQAAGKRWKSIEQPFMEVTIITAKMINMGVAARGGTPMPALPKAPGEAKDPAALAAENQWHATTNFPTFRDWSFGRIYVFPNNPFQGSPSEWCWMLASIPQNQSRWSSRLGTSSRSSGMEFLNFLIPGVGSVPVYAFLVLITIFTIVIGPLNYYWLRKTRRVGALVFTVPLIASVACMLLFVYSLVADGFSIRSRIDSVTFLDQQAKSAASISRLCLYAPFAPSAGLKFSPNVAAYPIWQFQQNFEGGKVDWTGNEQHLTSGWFRSQTWTQFLLVEQRDERGRLELTPPADAQASEVTISNGFSWDLKYLALELDPGQWYVGENIPAGSTAQLKLSKTDEVGLKFSSLSKLHAWVPPEALKESSSRSPTGMPGPGGFSSRPYTYGVGNHFSAANLSDGQLRRYLNGARAPGLSPMVYQSEWRNGLRRADTVRHTEVARPHYWALCDQNPGVEIGVKNTVDSGSFHLMFGVF